MSTFSSCAESPAGPSPVASPADIATAVANDYRHQGFCMRDDLLGVERAAALRRFAAQLHEDKRMTRGEVAYAATTPSASASERRGDIQCYVACDEDAALSALACVTDTLAECAEPGRSLVRGRAMMSCFQKGARFRTHYDNPNRNGRVLTFVYYLNDGWDAARDGGQLRAYLIRGESEKVCATVAPLRDRLVCFASARVAHEVLPVTGEQPRYAATIWYFDHREVRGKELE